MDNSICSFLYLGVQVYGKEIGRKMEEYQSNSKGSGCENWFQFKDRLPRELQKVLVRTHCNEMFVMTCRFDKNEKPYFTLSTYSPNFKLGDWYLEELLQWCPIPGFE